ncbi:aminoglycoside phosphotransferase family protein [Fluviispira multicolorata]|uniref:Streptomycin phosphotransferase n=1 Tax=Fluviispira multicolorata TaxID=2654512 RepID=A0A833N762_9BACT|nr:aminoglycoside phosphotransferase family protein [Fluviispira multicolorata]KAB8031855.1 streptomycin phosphotransferase [Fluviispira multicolorata]
MKIESDNASEIIEKSKKLWQLEHLSLLKSTNNIRIYVGKQNQKSIVLKLSLDENSLKAESRYLDYFQNIGAIRVLGVDKNLILMKKAIPGNTLKDYFLKSEVESLEIFCKVMLNLQKNNMFNLNEFPHISEWLSILDKEWKIPIKYIAKAKKLRDYLLESSADNILLHGDLHHENILLHNKDWFVIDPKGVIGEREYEIGAFIRNPISELSQYKNASEIIENRIYKISAMTRFEKRRIAEWCFVQIVLSWAWALEDNLQTKNYNFLTNCFYKIIVNKE